MEKKAPQAEEFFDEPINEIIVEDDCYYLACSKGSSCPDSRELGYFTRNDFIGRYMAWPDQIKDEYIKPIYNTLKRGFGWVYAQIASILF